MTMDDIENDDDEERMPKINKFTRDLSNWLTIVSIVFLITYGILTLVYEIVLDLTHVRRVFFGFLIFCAIDVISYWICRFALQDSVGGEKCLLSLVLISQCVAGLYYIVAPIVVLCTFRLIPQVSVTQTNRVEDDISTAEKEPENEEQFEHTFEEYVNPDPCAGSGNNDETWQCGYVHSIKTAAWWMMVLVIPKFLMCYLVIRIIRMGRRK